MDKKEDHESLLQAATSGNTEEILRLLLMGHDINGQDRNGWTPLMEAVWNGHVSAVRLLLEKGAEAGIRNRDGYTALMYASVWGRKEIIELLKSAEDGKTQT